MYLDDIIVLGKSFENGLGNLRNVLHRFRDFNLKLKPKKCELFKDQVEFLGKLVIAKGMSVSPSKVDAVWKWPMPNTHYHRDHVSDFTGMTASLYDLAHTTEMSIWETTDTEAFAKTKVALISAPCLAYPTPDGHFILDTDASDLSIGAVRSQIQKEETKVICYARHVLLKVQRNYCTTREELLAVVKFCRYFRHYLLGRRRCGQITTVWSGSQDLST